VTNFNRLVHARWHVKRMAAWLLAGQWYSIYLPPYLKRRRRARCIGTTAAPPFPQIDRVTHRCRSIQIGVQRLVCNGDEAACIPEPVGSVAAWRTADG
jgi:transcriptional antiterminator RfaH